MKLALRCADYEPVLVFDAGYHDVGEDPDARRSTFRLKHAHDLPRRTIAKKLPECLFVIGNAMFFD
jgi:hypothetical protein